MTSSRRIRSRLVRGMSGEGEGFKRISCGLGGRLELLDVRREEWARKVNLVGE